MALFHLGGALWLFRWVFRDPRVDIRFLLVGALVPDLVDMPIGTLFLADRYSTPQLWMHSLVAASVFMAGVLVLTRRGRRRKAWMALGVGWLFHLLLDGMWASQEVFLWPFFGWEFTSGAAPFWPMAWERALSDPWRWVREALGLIYLAWLWLAVGLNDPTRRAGVRETGRLPGYVAESV